jgi:hypothetical protein
MSERNASMRLVRVKFLGPTNTKGSRYSVNAFGRRLTVPADYSLSPSENAFRALVRAMDGLPWKSIDRAIPYASGFAFVVTLADSYRLTFTVEA